MALCQVYRIDPTGGILHCNTPPRSLVELPSWDHLETAISVSLNGQQFTDGLPFEYDLAASVSRISPSAGPQLGGVVVYVYGSNLRSPHPVSGSSLQSLSCAFGDTVVPGTIVNGSGGERFRIPLLQRA